MIQEEERGPAMTASEEVLLRGDDKRAPTFAPPRGTQLVDWFYCRVCGQWQTSKVYPRDAVSDDEAWLLNTLRSVPDEKRDEVRGLLVRMMEAMVVAPTNRRLK
jgi:hypothetical protein